MNHIVNCKSLTNQNCLNFKEDIIEFQGGALIPQNPGTHSDGSKIAAIPDCTNGCAGSRHPQSTLWVQPGLVTVKLKQ